MSCAFHLPQLICQPTLSEGPCDIPASCEAATKCLACQDSSRHGRPPVRGATARQTTASLNVFFWQFDVFVSKLKHALICAQPPVVHVTWTCMCIHLHVIQIHIKTSGDQTHQYMGCAHEVQVLVWSQPGWVDWLIIINYVESWSTVILALLAINGCLNSTMTFNDH